MKILLMNQFFYPDVAPTGQLMAELAVDLVRKGCEVTVITGRRPYAGSCSARFPSRENYEGIQIFRTWSTGFARRFTPGRVLDYATFFCSSLLRSLILKRHDVVISMTTPPWMSAAGWVLKRIKGTRFVCWLQDLYPDVAERLGLLRSGGWVYRALRRVFMHFLRGADRLIVLSPFMKHRLARSGVCEDLVDVIPNWADGAEITPVDRDDNPIRRQWGLNGRFAVLYSGNLGRCHHYETLMGAIQDLQENPDVLFIFIGDGYGTSRLKAWKEERGLANMLFLPYQDRAGLSRSLGAGDVHLVTLREGMEDLMVPSKLYSAMAAGRPVLFVGPPAGEVPRVVNLAECGRAVLHGDSASLKAQILRLYHDRDLVRAMGENARRYFEANFDRPLATQKIYECLRSLL